MIVIDSTRQVSQVKTFWSICPNVPLLSHSHSSLLKPHSGLSDGGLPLGQVTAVNVGVGLKSGRAPVQQKFSQCFIFFFSPRFKCSLIPP